MTTFDNWRFIPAAARGAAVALGNFDGVHKGHLHLFRSLHHHAPTLPLGAVTFSPHPREFFCPQNPPFMLTPPHMRAKLLAQHNVSRIYQIAFDEAFSQMSAESFVEEVLHQHLGVLHVACGHNFAFGHGRQAGASFLREKLASLGIGLTVVTPLEDSEGPYSSSRIRRWLQAGHPERAADALGRYWSLEGPVMHGEKKGRTIGFPTANMSLGRCLEPARGVYAVRVRIGENRSAFGVANIGLRPTLGDGVESRLEVHLFDFDENLYDQTIEVFLCRFLREEQRFENFESLRAQINVDAVAAREVLQAL